MAETHIGRGRVSLERCAALNRHFPGEHDDSHGDDLSGIWFPSSLFLLLDSIQRHFLPAGAFNGIM